MLRKRLFVSLIALFLGVVILAQGAVIFKLKSDYNALYDRALGIYVKEILKNN